MWDHLCLCFLSLLSTSTLPLTYVCASGNINSTAPNSKSHSCLLHASTLDSFCHNHPITTSGASHASTCATLLQYHPSVHFCPPVLPVVCPLSSSCHFQLLAWPTFNLPTVEYIRLRFLQTYFVSSTAQVTQLKYVYSRSQIVQHREAAA